MELVLEKAHEAWAWKEQGYHVDLRVYLARHDRLTGKENEPEVEAVRRGWGVRRKPA